jgi:hypothetical protein
MTDDGATAETPSPDFYALARKIPGLKIPQAVTVLGIGGHGSWPALLAVLSGAPSILITDMGRVEDLDIGRTPYRPSDIGRFKTEALADIIRFFRPNVNILTINRKLSTSDTDIFHGEILFNELDNPTLANWLPGEAAKHNMKYIHGFYYEDKVGVTDSLLPDIKYVPGNAVPVWTGSAAMSGCLAIVSAFSNTLNYCGNLSELSMPSAQLNAWFVAGNHGGA